MSQEIKIEQFNISFDPEQDRLLLRFRLSTADEFRFWLTRRYVNLLWGVLIKISEEFSIQKAPSDRQLRNTLSELAHDNAINNADFSNVYQEGRHFPLGETPILLAKISVAPLQTGTQILTLLPQTGQGINISVDENLLHVLAGLIQEAARKAEWGLDLRVASDPDNALAISTPSSVRVLH